MTTRIVTDSSCDLPPGIIEKYRITVLPVFIHAGGMSYRDGIDLTHQEFYERLPDFKPTARTAAPGPEVFRAAFEQLASEGASEILAIHISSHLSAIVDVARSVAREFQRIPVTVFDSRQLSLGTGFQVLEAAEAVTRGLSAARILPLLEEMVRRIHVFAALDTMEYLKRSGRVNVAISTLSSLLQIKPLMKMHDGVASAERVRTRHGALKRLVELLREFGPFERVALLHTQAEERARALLREVRSLLPEEEIWVEEITPVLGAHVGPGVVGFACLSAEPGGERP